MTNATFASAMKGESKKPPLVGRTVVGDSLESLANIYEPDVNVCVARRRLPFCCAEASSLREGSTIRRLASEDIGASIDDQRLVLDLTFVSALLCDLTGADDAGIRLHHSTSPMCSRLHVDHLPLRLVCTYLGQGTEWIDQSQGDDSFDVGNTQRQGTLRRAQAGDIVLLKGEGWVGNEGRGAIHRSPAHRNRRIVASLDPLWRKAS